MNLLPVYWDNLIIYATNIWYFDTTKQQWILYTNMVFHLKWTALKIFAPRSVEKQKYVGNIRKI